MDIIVIITAGLLYPLQSYRLYVTVCVQIRLPASNVLALSPMFWFLSQT